MEKIDLFQKRNFVQFFLSLEEGQAAGTNIVKP